MATIKIATKDTTDALGARLATAEAEIATLGASQASGMRGYATRADLEADLAHDEGTLALVTHDPTPANNGTYRKVGASGTGSWEQSSFDRVAVVEQAIAGMVAVVATDDAFLELRSLDPEAITTGTEVIEVDGVPYEIGYLEITQ